MNSVFGKKDRPFVIAEIGNNHEGDFSVAKEMVQAAKEAGVDAVKFQMISPEGLVTRDQISRIEQLGRFSLSSDQFRELAQLSKDLGLVFFSSVFDCELVDRFDEILDIYKVSSGDSTYIDLIEKVASTGKPTIISTGGLRLSEMKRLKSHFQNIQPDSSKLALLHCVSQYPTHPDDAFLIMIERMKMEIPNTIIGYSDHTLGNQACFIAGAMGAEIIEKHFTLSHSHSEFRDHSLSANPRQMKELVDGLAESVSLVGRLKIDKERADIEMAGVRRRAVASRAIKKGETFSEHNVAWLRVTSGNGESDRDRIYGAVAAKAFDEQEVIVIN